MFMEQPVFKESFENFDVEFSAFTIDDAFAPMMNLMLKELSKLYVKKFLAMMMKLKN